jgi:PAS domain S-box-containing protein
MGAATPDELLGKTDFDFFPKELAAKYYADEQAIFQSGQPRLEIEEPTVERTGTERWISTTRAPLRDAQGQIFGLVGMGREITERKRAEKALARERTFLNTLMDNVPDFIYFKDASSRFVRISKAQAQAFGLRDPAEVVGKTDSDFFTEEHARGAYEDEQRIIRTGQPIVGLVEKETWPDRPDTWASTTKMPLRDEKGNIVGTFGISRDITERKQMEEALVKRTSELQAAYQTLKEGQEKLLIAEKMASLGRLTAGIAHEMNTPLAAVRAALAEIEKLTTEYQSSLGDPEVTPDDYRGIAQDMQHSISLALTASERAASFVRSIKSQTRDMASAERQPFNMVSVINEALLLMRHALRKANCTASFEHPRDTIELFGLPGRLAQIITNLVTNAIDASAGSGGGPITLRLTPAGDGLDLQVGDQGCGITPEVLPKIFDPMFTTKPFGEGTGLGLAIVRDIVTGEFGGTIQVSTQLGQGTTFSMHFPSALEIPNAT